MKKTILILLTVCLTCTLYSQSLYVPNGTSGIGTSSNGNIGIGTTDPKFKLDVNGFLKVGGTSYTQIQLADRSWGGSHAILFNAYTSPSFVNGGLGATGNTKFANNVGNYSGGAGGIFYNGNGGNMYFRISETSTGKGNDINWGTPELTIKRNGRIGIGTTDPAQKLDVNGFLKVGGSDYTNIQLADRTWGGSHAILFNAYTSSSFVNGGLGATGNTKFANNVGNYSGGAGGIFFNGNGGNMYFRISEKSTGKGNDINWGTPELMIKRNGNVGIGTSSPTQKLDVNGFLKVGGSDYTNIQLADRTWGGSHAILFNAYTSSSFVNGGLGATGNTKFANNVGNYSGGAGGIFFNGNGGNMYFRISETSTGKGKNINWGTPELMIKRNGNVGIGTSSPTQKLDVNGFLKVGGTSTSQIQLADRSYSGSHAILFNAYTSSTFVNGELGATGNTKFANNVGNYSGGAGGIFFNGNGGNMYFRISGTSTGKGKNIDWGTPELMIKRNGNVGIGTAAPKNKLSVNGTIWAKEVVVSLTDAADWVFEDDYVLKPLPEVETFINKNKHLPDIPSANEFREKDLNVAEMDNKLLQKIEELTLYLIDQNKQIQKQNIQILKLTQEVEELKNGK